MLQEFPAETVVIRVEKSTPGLEGFVSEAGQPPPQRVLLPASQPRQGWKWLVDVGAPAMALLAPAAIVVVVLVSSRPATVLSPGARRATDIALPAASVRSEPEIPTLAVRFQTVSSPPSAPKVASRLQPVDTPPQPPPVRLKPDATGANTPRPSYERLDLPIAQPAPPPVIPQASPVISASDTNSHLETRAVVPPPERLQAVATPVNTIADEQPAILAAINRYQAAYETSTRPRRKKCGRP